jgi:hypothetical protein
MKLQWQGSMASDREGLSWVVTDKDFPGAELVRRPQKLFPSTYVNVGISVQQVMINFESKAI